MSKTNKDRNHAIDSLKFICAILVIFIHCEYPYKEKLLPITDVAVPLFFAISGYFVFGIKRSWGRIERIVKIFLWSAILYLLKTEVFQLLISHKLWLPTWKNILDFIIFNDVVFSIHLWYLAAYIYILLIVYLIDKYSIWHLTGYFVMPLLLIGGFIKYSILDICPNDIQYYRNAYFYGLPYFILGGFVKKYVDVKLTKYSRWVILPIIMGLVLIRYELIGVNLTIIILKEIDLVLLVFCVLVFTVISRQTNYTILSKLGYKYSLYIYIFHLVIMQVCETIVKYVPEYIENVYMYINPFVVLFLSIVFTRLLIKNRIIKA